MMFFDKNYEKEVENNETDQLIKHKTGLLQPVPPLKTEM